MGTIPTIATATAGSVVTAAYVNSIKAANDFWALTPQCYAYMNALPANFTTSVGAAIGLDAEIFDIVQSGDTASHDNTTQPSRMFARTTGKYEVSGQVQYAFNATGIRVAAIRMNAAGSYTGGTLLVQNSQQALTGTGNSTSASCLPVVYPMNAGDYIELFGWQNSGGSLGAVSGSSNTFLRMRLVAA